MTGRIWRNFNYILVYIESFFVSKCSNIYLVIPLGCEELGAEIAATVAVAGLVTGVVPEFKNDMIELAEVDACCNLIIRSITMCVMLSSVFKVDMKKYTDKHLASTVYHVHESATCSSDIPFNFLR